MTHLERAFDGQNQWWKYLIMVVITLVVAQTIGSIPLGVMLIIKNIQNGNPIGSGADMMDFEAMGIGSNTGLVLMLIPFVFSLFAFVLMIKPLHKRTFAQTINGTATIRWQRYFVGLMVWGAIMALFLLVNYFLTPDNFTLNLQWGKFIPLIIISLLLLPIQTAYEEVLFRGYLAQGVAGWTRQRWLVLIIPSVLFALMHIMNPEVATHGFFMVMPQYLFFGLMFGATAILDDGIEVTMGAHAANNIFLSIFVTNASSTLQTPAPLVQNNIDPLSDLIWLIVCGSVFLFVLGKKYQWQFNLLQTPVQPNN